MLVCIRPKDWCRYCRGIEIASKFITTLISDTNSSKTRIHSSRMHIARCLATIRGTGGGGVSPSGASLSRGLCYIGSDITQWHPQMDWMTHACENIALPQTSFAGVKITFTFGFSQYEWNVKGSFTLNIHSNPLMLPTNKPRKLVAQKHRATSVHHIWYKRSRCRPKSIIENQCKRIQLTFCFAVSFILQCKQLHLLP